MFHVKHSALDQPPHSASSVAAPRAPSASPPVSTKLFHVKHPALARPWSLHLRVARPPCLAPLRESLAAGGYPLRWAPADQAGLSQLRAVLKQREPLWHARPPREGSGAHTGADQRPIHKPLNSPFRLERKTDCVESFTGPRWVARAHTDQHSASSGEEGRSALKRDGRRTKRPGRHDVGIASFGTVADEFRPFTRHYYS